MIYDCFTFLNENDLVEVRLRHLDPFVHRFVIVEGSRTHSGRPKDWKLDLERFAWAREKIIYIQAQLPEMQDRWDLERLQRHYILNGLQDAAQEYIVLISDCDEIPSHEGILRIPSMDLPKSFQMKACMWYANMVNREDVWVGTVAATMAQIRQIGFPRYFRQNRFGWYPRIENGGCHFSFLGSPDFISYKIGAFAHSEFDTPENRDPQTLKNRRELGLDPFGGGSFGEYDITDVNFPPYLRENRDKYPDIFKVWP